MQMQFKARFLIPGLASALLPLSGLAAAASAADSATVQSRWNPQEIRYSYVAFTTAYDCDAYEHRVEDILRTLGAHPGTKVRARGCEFNRPSRNFFVTITTAVPRAMSAPASASMPTESERELIKRLGGKSPISEVPFPASWKTVELSEDRKLDLRPGDCELMEGLRDHVFPKLSIKVVEDGVRCIPHQLGIIVPELTVSALVPLPSPDSKGPDSKGDMTEVDATATEGAKPERS